MEKSMEQKIDTSLSKYSMQDYMSIGYVVLLILGVISQTIYYGFLGINIFNYTSVLDVLLSPISILMDNWIIAVVFIIVLILSVPYFKLMKKYYSKLAKKEKYQTGKNKVKIDKMLTYFNKKHAIIPFLLYMIVSMYVGFGLGGGGKIKNRINNFDYDYSHQIVFEDGEKKEVKIIGKNSLYIFYVTKKETNINIVPIDSNIKLIKKLKKKDKKE